MKKKRDCLMGGGGWVGDNGHEPNEIHIMYTSQPNRPESATGTTVGLVRHMSVRMAWNGQHVTVMAPVKLKVGDPSNGQHPPLRRGRNLVFALPGGKEMEVVSWL